MPNKIVVLPSHDADNDPLGGYIFQHRVLTCDVDNETGMLTYDTVCFPSGATPFAQHSSPDSFTIHVRELDVVGDDVLAELRDRDVEVVILE